MSADDGILDSVVDEQPGDVVMQTALGRLYGAAGELSRLAGDRPDLFRQPSGIGYTCRLCRCWYAADFVPAHHRWCPIRNAAELLPGRTVVGLVLSGQAVPQNPGRT